MRRVYWGAPVAMLIGFMIYCATMGQVADSLSHNMAPPGTVRHQQNAQKRQQRPRIGLPLHGILAAAMGVLVVIGVGKLARDMYLAAKPKEPTKGWDKL